MITAIVVLSGIVVFELFLIVVLVNALRIESQYNREVDPIDLVSYQKTWREIHDSNDTT